MVPRNFKYEMQMPMDIGKCILEVASILPTASEACAVSWVLTFWDEICWSPPFTSPPPPMP